MDKRRLIYILSAALAGLLVLAILLSQCSKEEPAAKKPTVTPQESTDPTVITPEEPESPTEYEPLEPTLPTEPEPIPPETTAPAPTTPEPTPEPSTPVTPGKPGEQADQIPNAIAKKADLQTLFRNFYCEYYNEDGDEITVGILREEGRVLVYHRKGNGQETVFETKNGVTTGYVREDETEAFAVDPIINDGHMEEVLELLSAQLIYSSNNAKDAKYRENPQASVKTKVDGARIYEIYEGEDVVGYVGIHPTLNICVFKEFVVEGSVYAVVNCSTTGWECPAYKPAS